MQLADILNKNRPLKGVHAGQRCFIVANGPSLKAQDLSLLEGEIVITVNSFFHHPLIRTIAPRYWVIADPVNWEQPDEHLIPRLEGIQATGLDVKLFMPSQAAPVMARLPYGLTIEPHFFAYDYGNYAFSDIDFTRSIPPFGQTVPIPALMLALYLGCDPIYFLGCDHDWWGWTRENYHSVDFQHFYPDQRKSTEPFQNHYPFDEIERAVATMRYEYGRLKEFADRKGVRIFNATHGGYFDTFPRVDYESLFPGGTAATLQRTIAEHLASDPLNLAQAAHALLKGDPRGALALVERALAANANRFTKVRGLNVLKATCLARLGMVQHAVGQAELEKVSCATSADHADRLLSALKGGKPAPEFPIEALDRVLPTLDPATAAQWAQARVALGEQCFERGDAAEAYAAFVTALDLHPDWAPAHNNLAVVYWYAGLAEQAITHFKQALTLEPGNRDALLNCLEVYQSLERDAEAVALLEDFLTHVPGDAVCQELLAGLRPTTRNLTTP